MIRSFLRSLLQPFHKSWDTQHHLSPDALSVHDISLEHLARGHYGWKPTNLHTITRDLMDEQDAARMQ